MKQEHMDNEWMMRVINAQINECLKLLSKKNKEYIVGKSEDPLGNFRRAAGLLGTTPEAALFGMLAKHLVSISDMCNSGERFSQDVWNEKITDAINYLLMLRCLVIERYTNDYWEIFGPPEPAGENCENCWYNVATEEEKKNGESYCRIDQQKYGLHDDCHQKEEEE